jgi:GT2 family glycosyltransferase
LRRCLAALVAMRDARHQNGQTVDLLVVDNAPTDDQTRIAAAFPGVRYVVEPVPGLDFARNRALAETDRQYLAFIDDDAVVDSGWLDRLAEAVQATPNAAAFTGPVLPLRLETEAQLRFERAGGFGEGIAWEHYDRWRWGDVIYPAGAGRLGTGANMVFSTAALRAIGGFDEALDTGPPLPGGGDLDSFYRIVRAGCRLVYTPGLLVHHEHRREMAQLRKQYHSWGLAVMALAQKNRAQDPETRPQHRRFLRWWLKHHARRLSRALLRRGPNPPSFVLAEILGALQGYFGEYQRSTVRVASRKREHGA